MGYLVCNSCGTFYSSTENELANLNTNCNCGGSIKYVEFINEIDLNRVSECPNCGFNTPIQGTFCGECGEKLEKVLGYFKGSSEYDIEVTTRSLIFHKLSAFKHEKTGQKTVYDMNKIEGFHIKYPLNMIKFRYEGKLKSFFIEKKYLNELDKIFLSMEVTEALMVAQGVNKRLEVYEHKIRIKRNGVNQSDKIINKDILINQITAIDFKSQSFIKKNQGYIRFEFPGSKRPKLRSSIIGTYYEDEDDTVFFDSIKTEDFEKIKEMIESKMIEFHSSKSDNELDDLEKLAELKEKRIITEEEFQAKKKQILKI